MTFEYAAASKIEEDKAAKAGKVDHLIMLYIGIVLATGENGHNKGGWNKWKESDSTNKQREDNIELAKPKNLKKNQAEGNMLNSHHNIIRNK